MRRAGPESPSGAPTNRASGRASGRVSSGLLLASPWLPLPSLGMGGQWVGGTVRLAPAGYCTPHKKAAEDEAADQSGPIGGLGHCDEAAKSVETEEQSQEDPQNLPHGAGLRRVRRRPERSRLCRQSTLPAEAATGPEDTEARAGRIADRQVDSGRLVRLVPAVVRRVDERICKAVRTRGLEWPPQEIVELDRNPDPFPLSAGEATSLPSMLYCSAALPSRRRGSGTSSGLSRRPGPPTLAFWLLGFRLQA